MEIFPGIASLVLVIVAFGVIVWLTNRTDKVLKELSRRIDSLEYVDDPPSLHKDRGKHCDKGDCRFNVENSCMCSKTYTDTCKERS